MKIAVTGGIGSGKSTLVNLLKQKYPGVYHASMDSIVHECLQLGVLQAYCLYEFGTTDRKEIGKIVFADDGKFKLLKLEAQMYDYIYSRCEEIFQNNKNVLMEVPLLYEKGYQVMFDKVINVSAKMSTRLKRVQLRDKRQVAQIKNIMSKQLPQSIKNQLCDFVYINEDDKNNLDQLYAFLDGFNFS